MSDMKTVKTVIAVDLKKYRIRVHKTALHQIGDPSFIQFLVNPYRMTVIIRAVEKEYSGDAAHRVRQSVMDSDNSVEVYSRSFIEELGKVVGGLDHGKTYRISGAVIPSDKMVLFSLKTIKRINEKGDEA